ncbi:PIN-like domain-containing protein [Kibdelosporangium philippinense]|uniref:PIN-like domain-containing protein n=1 Tax=Kibdelosporangium philippinense TaxID=211113 RepID=A0ABS8ZUA3_9PSEU|nr:PIN-like domain-containing protein [Kibdelosporangium philippinense]MCE7010008.1 PIN-like domain-containing protein [Kibdelosporangium philippinense]
MLHEFWRNRESVLRNPRGTPETLKQLDNQRSKALTQITQWVKIASLSTQDISTVVRTLRVAFDSVRDAIEEHEDNQNDLFAKDTNADPLIGELEQILDGRVGPPLPQEELPHLIEEGKRRVEAEIAPGFKDVKAKGVDGAVGDFLVWEQVLRQAKLTGRDVLLVTAENKPDWWRMVRGELRSPHPDLIKELRTRAGVDIYMLQPQRLLDHAMAALKVSVHEGSSESVARVGSSVAGQEDLSTGGWSAETLTELLSRLDQEYRVQAAAIRKAGKQGGRISRDEVYELVPHQATLAL